MGDEAKKLKAAYMREWKAKNKKKVAEYNKRYWENKLREFTEKMEEIQNERL